MLPSPLFPLVAVSSSSLIEEIAENCRCLHELPAVLLTNTMHRPQNMLLPPQAACRSSTRSTTACPAAAMMMERRRKNGSCPGRRTSPSTASRSSTIRYDTTHSRRKDESRCSAGGGGKPIYSVAEPNDKVVIYQVLTYTVFDVAKSRYSRGREGGRVVGTTAQSDRRPKIFPKTDALLDFPGLCFFPRFGSY